MDNMTRPIVSISLCEEYEIQQVRKAVAEAMEHLGGMGNFVKPGDKVLLKVNLLFPSKPDEVVTSHPTVVKALIELIEKAGGKVIVGDSPGLAFTKSRLEKTYQKCQMDKAIEGTGAELNWNVESARVSNPDGKLLKSLEVIQIIEQVDKVITVPKLKTHTFTTFTGGTKILYGVIPGLTKAAYHAKLPDPKDFSDMLLDIQVYVKPTLTFMDGVIGMEGKGPSGGEAKKAGAFIASTDPVALDIVACNMIKLDPKTVPTISNAVERKMTTGKVEDIEIRGTSLENFSDLKFKLAMKKDMPIPRFILNFIGNRFTKKPVPDKNKCIGCGICATACPKHCIQIADKLAKINYKECIRCYCCHELCPERAIELK